MDKLVLQKIQENEFDYEKVYNECLVDLSEEIQRPPVALGIGYSEYKGKNYLNPTFTYGEMSVIVAPQKSKKTFFKSALVASYIGGQSTIHFPGITSVREGEKYILDFDTEQGSYYAQRAFRVVDEMVGHHYNNYLCFGIKKLSDDERVAFIDAVINDPRYRGKIGWISIDGVADLCENTNDIEKSKKVVQKLMEWNDKGIHLNLVIHKTFEKERATGHIGSFVQKKAESIIFLSSTDPDNRNAAIRVKQKESRGAPFDDFFFDLDLNTVIPKECESEW